MLIIGANVWRLIDALTEAITIIFSKAYSNHSYSSLESSVSGTKVMAQKAHFTPKIRKCLSLPLAASVARDNPR